MGEGEAEWDREREGVLEGVLRNADACAVAAASRSAIVKESASAWPWTRKYICWSEWRWSWGRATAADNWRSASSQLCSYIWSCLGERKSEREEGSEVDLCRNRATRAFWMFEALFLCHETIHSGWRGYLSFFYRYVKGKIQL